MFPFAPLLLAMLVLPDPHPAPAPVDPLVARLIESHLEFLASDDLGGRETGTVQSLATGQYVASAMREAGLQPAAGEGSYLQSYPLEADRLDREATHLTLTTASGPRELKFADDFALRGFNSTGFDLNAECVFVGHGLVSEKLGVDELAGLDVTNKWVVVLEGAPKGREDLTGPKTEAAPKTDAAPKTEGAQPSQPSGQRGGGGGGNDVRAISNGRAKRMAAQAKGALGLITIFDDASNGDFQDILDNAEHPSMAIAPTADETPHAYPSISLKSEAGRALLAAGGVDLDQERTARASWPADAEGKPGPLKPGHALTGASVHLVASVVAEKTHAYNILGSIPGSDPSVANETVLVTAHNDHIGTLPDGRVNNGADDNASGTTTLLVTAEELAKRPAPRRTIVFLSVSGEEKGLWGSEWWVDHPTVPLADEVADINIDMVGRNDPDAVGATPSPEHPDYNTLVAHAVEIGPACGINVTWTAPAASKDMVDNYYSRSDHYNFARKGIPVVFFFSGLHADYHKPTDDLEKIDRGKIAKMVDFVEHLATDTANAVERPHKITKG
jgi:Zn-dependent M28 family amino/carboxypeptidase